MCGIGDRLREAMGISIRLVPGVACRGESDLAVRRSSQRFSQSAVFLILVYPFGLRSSCSGGASQKYHPASVCHANLKV
jgi:hypothetical protein